VKRPRGFDDYDTPWFLGTGAASTMSGPDDENEGGYPAAVLWLPDPEQRHGWRERYVWRDRQPVDRRALGFKKP
jgi:hypothetical protein